MLKNILRASVLTTSLLAGQVSAGEIVCYGKVEVLSYHAPDQMMIKLSGMNTSVLFCSPDNRWSVPGTSYTTGPETCKTLYSVFLAAKLSGKILESVYFDGDGTPANCNSFASWTRLNIRHFILQQ